mmetsp:Transcript_13366/g.26263  ORF Transcript_13366/g.26263 Transcript_13366/m.26263 type:complete len:80 (-) Transcript_13366:56-295(-)
MAAHIARKGTSVTLVVRDQVVCDSINKEHRNSKYLSDYVLPDTLTASSDTGGALKDCTCLVASVCSGSGHTQSFVSPER